MKEGAEAVLTERLLTHGQQKATSEMDVILAGKDATGRVISRSVAQDTSEQVFYPRMIGDAAGFGHVQCPSSPPSPPTTPTPSSSMRRPSGVSPGTRF